MVALYGCHSPPLTFIPFKLLSIIYSVESGSYHINPIVLFGTVSHVPAVSNQVFNCFLSLYSSAMSSSSPLVRAVSSTSSLLAFTFTGYNFIYGCIHVKTFSDNNIACALLASHISLYFTLKIGLTTKMSVNIKEYLSTIQMKHNHKLSRRNW